ncbi:hypothetical protein ACFV2U_27870 [Streptomyces sp. NPDC059697]|uniref:hypothetical protein n=1 Tax=Streptomyces sp. NPDC059697 TaxID=3346912 RepID=UPI0036B6E534
MADGTCTPARGNLVVEVVEVVEIVAGSTAGLNAGRQTSSATIPSGSARSA